MNGGASRSPKTAQLYPCGRSSRPSRGTESAAKFEEWRARLRKHIAGQGLKYTEQRWKIASLILSSGGHLDAQELVARVKRKHPGIGAATVYRNIKILCDASILNESLVDSQGRAIYEVFDEAHHDHIVCLDCGGIFEFHDPKLESLQDSAAESIGFEPVRHRHIVYARCKYKAKRSSSLNEGIERTRL